MSCEISIVHGINSNLDTQWILYCHIKIYLANVHLDKLAREDSLVIKIHADI